jgi:sugar/nucleoside kinase (ribokinase family)
LMTMNVEHTPSILLLGEAVIDLISAEFTESLEEAKNFAKFPGGQVANLAVNLSRLGFQTALGACLGDDGFGRFLLEHLRQTGVDLQHLQISRAAPTTMIPISRHTGTPDFSVYRGADQLLELTDGLLQAARRAKAIHTSAFGLSRDPSRSTIISILRDVHGAGKIISLDPNYHPGIWPDKSDFLTILQEVYQLITITKPSLDDSRRIFGPDLKPREYLENFLKLGPEIVILTMGADGVLLGTRDGKRVHLQAGNVPVVDVTGAGDAFWSGVLGGLIQSRSPLESARLGQALAEYKIGILGPIQEYLPWEEYQRRAQLVEYSDCS